MSKRFGDKQDNMRNGKKAKLEEEEFWEDELDEDAIDKAFEIATQQEYNPENDITYNAFKNPSGFSCSTQANIATTSTKTFSLKDMEFQIKKLMQENLEKEGEIAVLRSKIKQSNSSVQLEQQKTTNEWREKLHATEKEVKAVKTDLEFKNLEIVNLKQQLNAKQNMVRKINLEATLNNTQQFAAPTSVTFRENIAGPSHCQRENKVKPIHRRKAIIEPIYPLRSISPSSFECTPEDCHIIKSHSYRINRRNTIPYLQNQQNYNEDNFHHKCSKLNNNKRVTLKNIYPEVLKLVNSNSQEINCSTSSENIDKVLCVGLILLDDFQKYLEEYGSHLRTEDVQQADVNYVIQDVNGQACFISLQLGMEQSKILDLLSILLLCNQHIADFVCRDKLLKLSPNLKEYAILIPHRNGVVHNNFYFLNLLHRILQNIGKYRLTKQCSFFIRTVIKFLQRMTNLETEVDMNIVIRNKSNNLFNRIFKSIVFSRPDFEVIETLPPILKSAPQSKHLLGFLFNKDIKYELLKAGPKGVLNFNEGACTFCVLTLLLENYINKTPQVPLQVCCDMLSFMFSTFKISHWIHHEMSQKVCSRGCSCISQLYKLEIDIVYKGFSEFLRQQKNNNISEVWSKFLRHEIVQKVLNQMSFANLELVEKYVKVFSHFKDIEKALENEDLLTNTQFNTREELLKISSASFNKNSNCKSCIL